jgi:hypothetical protein
MAGSPREVDIQHTPDFLFEAGSILSFVCSVLFVAAILSTAVLAYVTSGFPTVGVLVSSSFGLLALLGVGLLYWSSKLSEG